MYHHMCMYYKLGVMSHDDDDTATHSCFSCTNVQATACHDGFSGHTGRSTCKTDRECQRGKSYERVKCKIVQHFTIVASCTEALDASR